MEPRGIGVLIGSDSDLPQCHSGTELLMKAEAKGLIKVIWADTASVHRNPAEFLGILKEYAEKQNIQFLITGAGWANHLSGMSDSLLRNFFRNTNIVVLAVAFKDGDYENTRAAVLSIKKVPGLQAIYCGVGEEGFHEACLRASLDLPPKIKIREVKPWKRRSLQEFYRAILEVKNKKEGGK